MKNTISKNGLMLGAFAVVTTALIALTFFGTETRIKEQQKKRLLSVLNEVVPAHYYDNKLYADCTEVIDPLLGNETEHHVYRARIQETPVALALEATAPDGYSGNIELVIGIDTSLTVLGVRAVEHKETPGLGDKIDMSVSDWITAFNGKTLSPASEEKWQVQKDGGQFDQFTGATITPRAVVSAVKRTLQYVKENQSSLFQQPVSCYSQNDGDKHE
ncbi:electron transport complex subunit RsxG [Aestuariibacter sp. A3R04]|uniref:electron transport complex subunit RsxG n=1 Tax=Aestuariibacter sp. A3R04 TaxID=2841571 RepID=UPI001C09A469|nr:electron transport complex subunit RsxG [Aestuariibacter sp. A3R04]MBU3022368.1 electron transport complex subunit RsxG [Aestuariibacter sp. A3R04]